MTEYKTSSTHHIVHAGLVRVKSRELFRAGAHMWPQAGSTPGAAAAHAGPQRSDPATGDLFVSVVGKATSSVRGAARAAAVVLPPAERGSTDPPSTSTGAGSTRPACRMHAMRHIAQYAAFWKRLWTSACERCPERGRCHAPLC